MPKHTDFSAKNAFLKARLRSGAPLEFTRHARERLRERSISELDIRQCVKAGYVIKTDVSEAGRPVWTMEAAVEGRRLQVVIGEPTSSGPVFVVTAFWK